MFDITTLPAVNATLNSIAAVLLTSGYVLIRRGRVAQHRLCMQFACKQFNNNLPLMPTYIGKWEK